MIVTQHSDHVANEVLDLSSSSLHAQFVAAYQDRPKIKTLPSIARLLSKEKRILPSSVSSCNGLVDAASQIFTMLGKLKTETTCPHVEVIRREFLDELKQFEKRGVHRGYHSAYLTVCRYVLSATIDDVLLHDIGFEDDAWSHHALLDENKPSSSANEFEPDKFYAILARASDTPDRYIDLLELMYLALSYGYQGELRFLADGKLILDRISGHLYERIRKERGQVSQRLLFHTPSLNKKQTNSNKKVSVTSIFFIFMLTLCIIMMIFIGLNYLMDVISNEADRTIDNTSQQLLSTQKL